MKNLLITLLLVGSYSAFANANFELGTIITKKHVIEKVLRSSDPQLETPSCVAGIFDDTDFLSYQAVNGVIGSLQISLDFDMNNRNYLWYAFRREGGSLIAGIGCYLK